MRLFEAILDANHRAIAGDQNASLHPDDFANELPVVALTCIDPRLNPLIPEVLGVPEEKFIWLRNAGNIITGPASSTMRSLALACAVKGGKEIAIIGHTDCLVAKTTMMKLTDALRALGVDRARLPENITEFFGLFGSERQNVIKACDIVRNSPLIGPKMPVHGLLVDIQSGKLEWLVNGYQTLDTTVSAFTSSLKVAMDKAEATLGHFEDFKIGDMKLPETKIGQLAAQAEEVVQSIGAFATAHPQAETPKQLVIEAAKDFARHIGKTQFYKIIGRDKRQYGPITGEKLLQWLADERVDPQTPVQLDGRPEWLPLEKIAGAATLPPIPLPPPIRPRPELHKPRR
jgi:carbonic anhydrase